MLRTAAYQHYWTVRGRGFNPKQWRALLRVTNRIVKNALADDIKVQYEAEADQIKIIPKNSGGEIFQLYRDDGNANTFNSVRTDMDHYDDVVVSILTAAKKIAPDLIEVSSDGGADVFRRRYANVDKAMRDVVGFAPGGGDGGSAPAPSGDVGGGTFGMPAFNIDESESSMEKAWDKAIKGVKVRNPDTGHMVLINSLSPSNRGRYRKEFEHRWKQQAAQAKQRAKQHAQKTKKTTEQARQKAEKGSGKAAPGKSRPKEKKAMNEQSVRDAAIRVAAETRDPKLKQAILHVLAGKGLPPEFLKNKIEKGSDADGDGKKNEGEGKKPWEKDDKDDKKKDDKKAAYEQTILAAYNLFLPVAQKSVNAFYAENPDSKIAGASTAQRVALAAKIAKSWIYEGMGNASLVRKASGVAEGEAIKVAHLDEAIRKATDLKTQRALVVAKVLQEEATKAASTSHVAMEELMAAYKYSEEDMAEMEKEGGCKLGKKWIQDAIKRPGRVREYLGIPEGKDIPMGKLNEAIKKEKGKDNKSLMSALLLAKRLKGMK
jgi:hypothetical protein